MITLADLRQICSINQNLCWWQLRNNNNNNNMVTLNKKLCLAFQHTAITKKHHILYIII